MRVLLVVLLVLFLSPSYSGVERLPLLGQRPAIAAERLEVPADHPARRGRGLRLLGAARLTSPDPVFGGFSALSVRGEDFLMLSDGGGVVRFRMGRDWVPRAPRFAELPDGPGRGYEKSDRDSESLAIDPEGRHGWIGFERANAIWRFDAGLSRAEKAVRPRAMKDWPTNGGAEAMARLRDGSFLVISESAGVGPKDAGRKAIWFSGDPVTAPPGYRFVFVPPADYDPTDLVELPDGRLLVLVRRLAGLGFDCKIVLVERAAIGPKRVVRGRPLLTLDTKPLRDNFEGLAVTREGRDTILWVVSDDNQSFLQSTLLLKYKVTLK
jgi:hypothetical protein